MSLKRQRRFSIRLDGVDYGVWDTRDGADVDSSVKKYYPGGMEDPVPLSSKEEIADLKTARLFSLSRDQPRIKTMLAMPGKQVPFVGTELFLDPQKNVVGTGLTYRGVVKHVTQPPHDSQSDDEAMVELEATITQIV